MTQTTLTALGADHPIHPADILMNLIITVLAPLFLTASGGDIAFARMAAFETVQSYRTRNHADLIAVAQIIACGLSVLGSLGQAMADDISLSMTIRLRGTATGLMRAAEQLRRAMKEPQPDAPQAHAAPPPSEIDEAAVIASVAEIQQRAAEHEAQFQAAPPQAEPQPPIPPAPPLKAPQPQAAMVPTAEDRHIDALWASAMADVASEFTADLPNLPPLERRLAAHRAAILSSTANQLITGTAPPRSSRIALNSPIKPPDQTIA